MRVFQLKRISEVGSKLAKHYRRCFRADERLCRVFVCSRSNKGSLRWLIECIPLRLDLLIGQVLIKAHPLIDNASWRQLHDPVSS